MNILDESENLVIRALKLKVRLRELQLEMMKERVKYLEEYILDNNVVEIIIKEK